MQIWEKTSLKCKIEPMSNCALFNGFLLLKYKILLIDIYFTFQMEIIVVKITKHFSLCKE
jgi:hypothetical protein